ncbi:MAG: LamG-like jellyroll fold domain-containing protein [Planctomycetota bacterium]|jgi:hypothetical protein
MNNNRDIFKLNELILMALDGVITKEELEHLNKLLGEHDSAVKNYIEFMDIYTEMGSYGRASMPLITHDEPELQAKKRFFQTLAEYKEKAETIKTEDKKKPLSEEEREQQIKAFEEQERRIREQEEVEREEQARAKHQRQRHLRMKEMLRRQRMLKLKRAALKTWKCTKVSAVIAMAAGLTYMGYLLIQPVPVAALTDTYKAKWYNPNTPARPDNKLLPGAFMLQEGYAEITFNDGAVVILEAPTHITIETTNKASLELGKITARVPVYSQGFTINTPTATIIDLGTEFGVEVKEDGTSDLHTFKGQIALSANYNGNLEKESQIVKAGFARRVVAGSRKIIDITFNEKAFSKTTTPHPLIEDTPVAEDALVSDNIHAFEGQTGSSYIEAVLNSKPVVYWRFDRRNLVDVVNSTGENPIYKGTYMGEMEFCDFGVNNDALKLDSHREGEVRSDGLGFAPSAENGTSIVFWIRADTLKEGNISLNVVNNSDDLPIFTHQLSMKQDGRLVFRVFALQGAERRPVRKKNPQYSELTTLFSNTPLQRGRWHHLAITLGYDGHVDMFIDGQPDASTQANPRLLDDDSFSNNFTIGLSGQIYGKKTHWVEVNNNSPVGNINGAIDEIALYDRALSAEEVKEIYKTAF